MFTIAEILNATGGKLIGHHRLNKTVSGVSTDSRQTKKDELFIAIKGEKYDGHDFVEDALNCGSCGAIVERGTKRQTLNAKRRLLIEVPDTVKALGDIARYHRRRFSIPIVAVTGSNGKTTTKEMIAAILGTKYAVLKNEGTKNNHIGVPQTILKLNAKREVAVFELGSNHPGEIRYLAEILGPTIGVITNIGPSHLEFFKDLNGVFKEKMELFENFKRGDAAVLNGDDKFLAKAKIKNIKRVTFGIRNGCDFSAKRIIATEKGMKFSIYAKPYTLYPLPYTLKILGEHNVYNSLAACAAASRLGVDIKTARMALENFEPPKMRLEVNKINGVTIIDDAYNSNPNSLRCAIGVLLEFKTKGKRILASGDMLELGETSAMEHYRMGEFVVERGLDYVVAVGKMSRALYEGAIDAGISPKRAFWCATPKEAGYHLAKVVNRGDVILVKGSRAMHMEDATRCFITSSTR